MGGSRYLAIIPARGGSKRIPRKNIRDFAGKPIVSYSIQAAIESKCFDEVMISTDDRDIALVGEQYGAKIPFFRTEKNSDDFSTIADVVLEVISEYEKLGINFEVFCCILPTAPFVTAERIREGLKIMLESQADSIVAITRFGYPIQRAMKIDQEGALKMFWPENYPKRSQDLEPSYHDTGQFYWIRTSVLREQKRFFTENTRPLIIPESEVQDIDSEEDWKIAELKYKLLV